MFNILSKTPFYHIVKDINYSNDIIKRNKTQIEVIKNIPQFPQKSKEWLEQRKSMITASNVASVINENPYSSRNDYLKEKAGLKKSFGGNSATIKGNIFEEIACNIYRNIYNKEVYEFGLIKHPDLPIGASPDGIREDGVMLEIKCPSSRVLTGIPPKYYWMQTQIQMECCDFENCHFMECKFDDINEEKFNEIINNNTKILNGIEVENPFIYAGLYVDIVNGKSNKIHYAELDKDIEYYDKFIDNILNEIEHNPEYHINKVCYWYLSELWISEISRDREWMENTRPEIIKFWEEVEELIKNPPEKEKTPPKRGRKLKN